MATDSDGKLHIVVEDDITSDLVYFNNVGGSFSVQTIAHTNSYHCAIAIDSDDKPHVVYYNFYTDHIDYATNPGGGWSIQTIASITYGWTVDIALDSDDKAHVVYTDLANSTFFYATNAGGSWANENPVEMMGLTLGVADATIALDSSDRPHILYKDTTHGDLVHAVRTSGDWDRDIVDSSGDVLFTNDMKVDSADKLHVTYYTHDPSTEPDTDIIWYANNVGGDWARQEVARPGVLGGTYNRLVLDSMGKPHICYFNFVEGSPSGTPWSYYAYRSGGTWQNLAIDDWGFFTNIAMDPTDHVYIFWQESTPSSALGYATTAVVASEDDVPTVPLYFTTDARDGEVVLFWDDPASDGGRPVTGYKIYRSTVSGTSGALIQTVSGSTFVWTDTEVVNGQTYYYRISAVNSVGEGPLSEEQPATPSQEGASLPGQITDLKLTKDDDEVTLSWTTPNDGGSAIQGYRIYRSTSSSSALYLATISPASSYSETLPTEDTYYYWVVAFNEVGDGPMPNSAVSSEVSGSAGMGDLTFIIIIIVVLVAGVVLVLYLVMRRGKAIKPSSGQTQQGPAQARCPSCGAPLTGGPFCGNCGRKM